MYSLTFLIVISRAIFSEDSSLRGFIYLFAPLLSVSPSCNVEYPVPTFLLVPILYTLFIFMPKACSRHYASDLRLWANDFH